MTIFANLAQKACYLIALTLVIYVEHRALARQWRRYEMSRWTIGVATVLGLSLPLVILGALDLATWVWLVAGFGIAGAVTAGLYTNDAAKVNAKARRQSKGQTRE